MKKLMTIALMFVLGTAQAQTVNGIKISELEQEYVQIVGQGKMFSTKVTIKIDAGQDVKTWQVKKQAMVLDANGEPLVLNSMIDAINFMYTCGYVYIDAYVITLPSTMGAGQNVYHYTMRKKK